MPDLAPNTQQGEVWSGLLKADDLPAPLREKGLSELGKLSYIFRGTTQFMNVVNTKFASKGVVSDREFKTIEISELARTFTVRVASTNTDSHASFGLSNDEAAQLEINDMMLIKNIMTVPVYTNLSLGQVIPGGANIGPDLQSNYSVQVTNVLFNRGFGEVNGTYFYDYETVLLVGKGQPDSAGTGFTTVTVRRCYHGGGRLDQGGTVIPKSTVDAAIAADTTNAPIQVGDTLLRMLPSWTEGSGFPDGFNKNPTIDNNFTQEFKMGFSVTHEQSIAKSFMNESVMDIKRKLAARRLMLDIERAALFGRKGKMKDVQGLERYQMGGVLEFIPKDAEHIIRHASATINYSTLLDVGEQVFSLGGGESRHAFMSYKLLTRLKKAFYNDDHFRFNAELSRKFDMPVESLIVPGGEIHLHPSYAMEEAGWTNMMLCLDLSVPAFEFVTHKGWDMKVEKDIAPKGTSIYKEGVVGIKGLRRRYAQYQSIVHFA